MEAHFSLRLRAVNDQLFWYSMTTQTTHLCSAVLNSYSMSMSIFLTSLVFRQCHHLFNSPSCRSIGFPQSESSLGHTQWGHTRLVTAERTAIHHTWRMSKVSIIKMESAVEGNSATDHPTTVVCFFAVHIVLFYRTCNDVRGEKQCWLFAITSLLL